MTLPGSTLVLSLALAGEISLTITCKTCIFHALQPNRFARFVSFSLQSDDAHEAGAGRGRISSTHRHTYSSTVPGRALVRWLDTVKEAIHQPVVFFLGRALPGSAGESVMLWLPFIKRQGYCGSGSTGAAAINKQTKREGLMNTTRLPSGSRNGEQDKGRGGGRETVSMLQDRKQTLTKKRLNKTWNILERLSLPPRAQRHWHKEMSSKALITYIPRCVSDTCTHVSLYLDFSSFSFFPPLFT